MFGQGYSQWLDSAHVKQCWLTSTICAEAQWYDAYVNRGSGSILRNHQQSLFSPTCQGFTQLHAWQLLVDKVELGGW